MHRKIKIALGNNGREPKLKLKSPITKKYKDTGKNIVLPLVSPKHEEHKNFLIRGNQQLIAQIKNRVRSPENLMRKILSKNTNIPLKNAMMGLHQEGLETLVRIIGLFKITPILTLINKLVGVNNFINPRELFPNKNISEYCSKTLIQEEVYESPHNASHEVAKVILNTTKRKQGSMTRYNLLNEEGSKDQNAISESTKRIADFISDFKSTHEDEISEGCSAQSEIKRVQRRKQYSHYFNNLLNQNSEAVINENFENNFKINKGNQIINSRIIEMPDIENRDSVENLKSKHNNFNCKPELNSDLVLSKTFHKKQTALNLDCL